MAEERVMVHFDEANQDLYRYVCRNGNKSAFIRDCIRAKMNQDKDLKEVVKEALMEVIGCGNINLINTSEQVVGHEEDNDMNDLIDCFDEY